MGGSGVPNFLGDIVNQLGTTSVDFVTAVVSTYWIYFLGIALVIGLAGAFWKLAKLGR